MSEICRKGVLDAVVDIYDGTALMTIHSLEDLFSHCRC